MSKNRKRTDNRKNKTKQTTKTVNWQFEYHRIKDSQFFWGNLYVLAIFVTPLVVQNRQGADFERVLVPLGVSSVLAAIVLVSYCVTARLNGMKKVYYYTLENGLLSYVVPPHRLTQKQLGSSEYLRQRYKALSFGAGEKGSYRVTAVTAIIPRQRARKIRLTGPEGRFTVRVGEAEFDAVLEALTQAAQGGGN